MKESAKKDSLSCRQATLILTYLLIGSAPISGIAKVANNNAPLSILGGALLIVPFYFLLYKMAITYNKNNIFEIAQLVFGKIIGKLIITALIFNTLYITIISYRLIIDFIQTAGLLNTNNLSIIFILCLISIQITKGGLKLYGKWAEFFFILIALGFCFLLITVLPVVKPKSFFPLFYDGFSNFYEGSLEVFCLPFSLSFISLSFFSQLPQKENTGKVLLKALPIATITLSITTLISIMTIGGKYSKTFYPLYLATRRIMLGQLIQRIELNLMQIFISSVTAIPVRFPPKSIAKILAIK